MIMDILSDYQFTGWTVDDDPFAILCSYLNKFHIDVKKDYEGMGKDEFDRPFYTYTEGVIHEKGDQIGYEYPHDDKSKLRNESTQMLMWEIFLNSYLKSLRHIFPNEKLVMRIKTLAYNWKDNMMIFRFRIDPENVD